MEQVLFWIFGGLSVFSATGVVLNVRNTINAALSLVVCMLSLAVLFIMLHAEFIGVLQVMVYAGAIVVLFLFVIMLLNLRGGVMGAETQPVLKVAGAGIVIAATAQLAALLRGPARPWPELPESFGQVRDVGLVLFTDYVLVFELAGVLLLTGIVAAVILAKKTID
jgi:NADH-quinone oxidoreductase subunit J